MMIAVAVLVGVLIGLVTGYYARTIRDLLALLADQAQQRKQTIVEAKRDDSGVIVNKQPYRKGETISLPSYQDPNSAIVRPRSPEQVKKDADREWNQTLNEYRG